MTLSVRDILHATGGRLVSGYPSTLCRRISIDTRTLRPGDVFFALRGPHFDGHAFLKTASEKNAQTLILERLDPSLSLSSEQAPDLIQVPDALRALQDTARFVRARAQKTKVIGLTGSNGKTTTKEMLAQILRRAGKTLSTRGNLNNHIGLPLMLCELDPDDQFAILELGTSQKGDMDLLVDLAAPQVGLITNVGKDHLEFFGTPEGVLVENRKLYDRLPKEGIAVINLDDPLLKELAGKLSCKTLTYGFAAGATVSAKEIRAFPAPLHFVLTLGKEEHPVSLQAIGDIQILNAMAAAAVAHALGIASKTIVEGLEAFKPAAMRMEMNVRADGTVLINDSYNANPSSMRASIDSFCRSYPDRTRWLVLGDMRELGGTSREEHEALGRWIGTQSVERVLLYGRDARFILNGIQQASTKVVVERYRKKRYLIEALKRDLGAVVKPAVFFKASRRMRLEQVIHALSSIQS